MRLSYITNFGSLKWKFIVWRPLNLKLLSNIKTKREIFKNNFGLLRISELYLPAINVHLLFLVIIESFWFGSSYLGNLDIQPHRHLALKWIWEKKRGLQIQKKCWFYSHSKCAHYLSYQLTHYQRLKKRIHTKGQLISKANFKVFIWTKKRMKYFCISALASKNPKKWSRQKTMTNSMLLS